VKVAVVGAGRWGINLVRTFYRLGALAAVVDQSPEALARAAAECPGVALVERLDTVLADEVAALAIATPAETHFEVAKRALLAGKDVFVEKPLALRAAEAEELAELAKRKGRVLMVGHLSLYRPAVRYLKEYLAAGELGRVYSLHAERLKLGRVRRFEDVLWSFGVHDLAVFLHLLDGAAPERVRAVRHCVLQEDVADDVYLHLEFPGGVRAHLHVSWLWPETLRVLTVVGERGMLVYDELAGTVTLHRKTVDANLEEWDEGTETLFVENEAAPLTAECRDFLRAVAERTPPLASGRQGVQVVRVLERTRASWDSVQEPSLTL